jgi:hypothetical protein
MTENARSIVVVDTRRVKIRRISLSIRYYVFDFSVFANPWHNSAMKDKFYNVGSVSTSNSKYLNWYLKLIFSCSEKSRG